MRPVIWLFAAMMLLFGHLMQAASPPPPTFVDQDLDLDGKPDLIWWRTDCNGLLGAGSCGEVWFWGMQGYGHTVGSQEYINQTNPNNYAGQFYAGGDFGSLSNGVPVNVFDGRPEILFRNDSADITVIGYQDYTPGTNTFLRAVTGVQIMSFPGTSWTIIGATDMGSWINGGPAAKDGKADIVWQNKATGSKAIWYMDGATRLGIQTFAPNSPLNAAGWNLAAVGDFGSSTNNSTKDGQPDLLLVNQTIFPAQLGIQYTANSQGLILGQAGIVLNPQIITNGFPAVTNIFTFGDGDLRIFNAGDFGTYSNILVTNIFGAVGTGYIPAPSQDSKTDIVVRHQTDARTFFWMMDGINFKTEAQMNPQRLDTVWRLCPQDINPSTWRVTSTPISVDGGSLAASTVPIVTATGITGPPARIDLTWTNVSHNSQTNYAVLRRVNGTATWTTIVASTNVPSFSDTTIATGTIYDYKVVDNNIPNSQQYELAQGGVSIPAVHNRGKALLLIETNLASQIGTSLNRFTNDLIGDGWQVIINPNAPRHIDAWTTSSIPNGTNVLANKAWIKANTDATTKAVIILGHVTVPYSGLLASDGHSTQNGAPPPHHAGAWSADVFYGDIAGDAAWQDDSSTSLQDSNFNENDQYPNDGKFTNDYATATIQLAVGRIDFARLTSFGIADNSTSLQSGEVALINQYLSKNHNYRLKTGRTFPLLDQIIATTYVDTGLAMIDARRATESFYGSWPGKLTVGEPFRDNYNYLKAPLRYIWAFTEGGGYNDQIYNSSFNAFNPSGLVYTTDLIKTNSEPLIGFWAIHGSFFADFNLSNNIARGILAKPSFTLAVLPSSAFNPRWRLGLMALGDTLGASFLYSINNNFTNTGTFPTIHRWLSIQGDPTLRHQPIKPPAITGTSHIGTTVTLNWNLGESGSQYYVYRAAAVNGPYTLLTPTPLAVNTQTYSTSDSASQTYYMVRGALNVVSGIGSYENLSQGAMTNIP
ncbi:MAG: hypothetical protein HY043_00605 [Verrucomicrobia bacterium]|nr:hypothetical protein [Verrucomicrobiota bacterium]